MNPPSWQSGALRRFASIVNGGTPTADEANWGGSIPWATPVDLGRVDGEQLGITERTLTPQGLLSGSAAVPAGSCLLSTRAPIGYVALVNTETAFNQGCKGVVPRAGVDSRFLLFLLVAARKQMAALGQGSTFTELSATALGGLSVVVPPRAQQRSIADYLDRETAEIDAFIAGQEELIALLEERRSAEIDSAVLRDRSRLVEVRRLGTRMQSGTSVNGENSPIEPGEVGVLRTGAASKGYLDLSENKRVVPEDVSRVSCLLRVGTLLVNRANTADLVASSVFVDRSDPGLYLSDKLWQVEFQKASSEFMALWAQTTDYRQQVKLRCVGSSSTMQNLSYENYLNLQVPLYALERQGDLVRTVEREVTGSNAAIADAREAIALSKERRAALISAAVTGQIDVTERKRVLV